MASSEEDRRDRQRGMAMLLAASERLYGALLALYPKAFRSRYAAEMRRDFADLSREGLEEGGAVELARVWAATLPDLALTALKERSTMLARNTYRSVVGVALATALILLIPLLAMQFTDEVAWTLSDFVIAGALIFGTGLTYVLVARKADNVAYRFAVGVALAAAFLLFWITGAVGIIGTEDNPANLMYVGVLAVWIIGVIIARFRPHGMARALYATALAQASVAVIALIFGLGSGSPPGVLRALILNGFFVALFAGSSWLFQNAGRERTPAGAGQEG